ncbi:MAG TPA: glycosyltransferase [Planctomycetota bacterium]|nr:glycosyltransferase [Planctomycetota bacterium]
MVIFGLTISSSWGNGHATLWRALCRALARRGHEIVFFEKDVPYYAAHRDFFAIPRGRLHLYSSWESIVRVAAEELRGADVGLVTSYCPDAPTATELVLGSSVAASVFYDLDSPVTLERLRAGEEVFYIGPRGLSDFDLVLSYAGGKAIDELRDRLGARRVTPIYGSVDPEVHRPAPPLEYCAADLSYLGTYATDRQDALERLFIEPARRLPNLRFLIAGAQYPEDFPWTTNIFFVRHLPPSEHPGFFSSCSLTLNVTRSAMAEMGYCPSGRLFEAAACGAPILSDDWEGLDTFFAPGEEILIARDTGDAIDALKLPREELSRIARNARERVLDEHTSDRRGLELERALERVFDTPPSVSATGCSAT